MPVIYKFDVLEELKARGYSTYRLRKEKLLGEATIQQIRVGKLVSWENIGRLCVLLKCQPGDIVMFSEETDEAPI